MMNSVALVSIIVPVYNVEEFLGECLKSILNQTYFNLEVLLIDDGSTDNCHKICEEYSKRDNRVKVFHKENGGLSDARNYGMKYITGSYFMFVDSDDVLDLDLVEISVKVANETSCEVVICNFARLIETEKNYEKLDLNGPYERTEIIKHCFKGDLLHSACGKLFKSDIKDELEFPKDRYFEDEFAIYNVLLDKSCAVTNKTAYIYRKRDGSITQAGKTEKKNKDLFDALENLEKSIDEKAPELKYMLDYKILQDSLEIIKNDIKINKNGIYTQKTRKKIKQINNANLKHMEIGPSYNVQYILIRYFFPVYRLLFGVMYKLGMNRQR